MSLLGLCPLQPARTTLSSSSIERLVPPPGSIRGSILSPPPWGLRAVGGPADHSSFWRRFSSLAPRTPPSPSSVYSLVTTSRQSVRAAHLPGFFSCLPMLPHLVVLSSLKGLTSHIPQRSPNLRHSLDMHTQQPTSLGGLTRIANSKSRYSLKPSRPPLCKWHIYPSNSPAQKLHGHPLTPVPHLSVNPTGLSERPEHGHPSRWPRLPPSPSVTFQTMTATASCVLPDPTLASSTFPAEPPLQSQNVHLTSLLGSKPSDASPKCRIKAKIRRTSPKALPRLASLPSPSICSPAPSLSSGLTGLLAPSRRQALSCLRCSYSLFPLPGPFFRASAAALTGLFPWSPYLSCTPTLFLRPLLAVPHSVSSLRATSFSVVPVYPH